MRWPLQLNSCVENLFTTACLKLISLLCTLSPSSVIDDENGDSEDSTVTAQNTSPEDSSSQNSSPTEITEAEQQVIQQLEARDREVRAHEQAHAAVGGSLAGAPSYDYQTGPDGKRYAVGGEVSIDVSKESDPEDTIRKMQTVQAAALAPAEPSSQDRKVAAQASRYIAEARIELAAEVLQSEESENAELTSAEQVTETEKAEKQEAQQEKRDAINNALSETTQQTAKTNAELAQEKAERERVIQTAKVIANTYTSSSITADIQFNAVA